MSKYPPRLYTRCSSGMMRVVRIVAADQGITKAELIRQSLREYLKESGYEPPLWRFSSGRKDIIPGETEPLAYKIAKR